MSRAIEVGVLGATGMVGQQFLAQLASHPWFRPTWLAASERSEGKRYSDAAPWRLAGSPPEGIVDRIVESATPGVGPRLVFSALDASVAGDLERAFAEAGHVVVSNARNHRLDAVVPLLVPEVNADHLGVLEAQRAARGWKGLIVTNPNCSTVMLTMALAPLRAFDLRTCIVTTLQAVSGAGYPGVPSYDILGNVIPFISGEEEKIEVETRKILGRVGGDGVEYHGVVVSASTTRVPVIDGHTESVSVALGAKPSLEDVRQAFESFTGLPQQLGLPSAPAKPVVYLDAANRPQPRFDVAREGGMAVTVGRLRPCRVLDAKFFVLGHNTVRGAAGAAVLNGELMVAQGWVD
jgi:aspartate-semialdehyde dehydrogenase